MGYIILGRNRNSNNSRRDVAEDVLLAAGFYLNFEKLNKSGRSYAVYLAKAILAKLGLPWDVRSPQAVWKKMNPSGGKTIVIVDPDTKVPVAYINSDRLNGVQALREVIGDAADTGGATSSDGSSISSTQVNNHDEGILNFLGIDLLSDDGWLGNLL